MSTTHRPDHPPAPRRTRLFTTTVRGAAAVLLAATLASCGNDVTPAQAGAPPASSSRAAHAADAARYVDLQVDRASSGAGEDDHRAHAAAARRYVDSLTHRAATAEAAS